MALTGGQGFGVEFLDGGVSNGRPCVEKTLFNGLQPCFFSGAACGGMEECNQVGLAACVKEEIGLDAVGGLCYRVLLNLLALLPGCLFCGLVCWLGSGRLEVKAPEAIGVAATLDYWLILVVDSDGCCVHLDGTTIIG